MQPDRPATVPIALAGVVSTGVALFAILLNLDPALQTAIIAFGNALIVAGTTIYLNPRVTSVSAPVVPAGTEVAMIGSTDTVTVNPEPPGPQVHEDAAPADPDQ
jgi:hypothetical protein